MYRILIVEDDASIKNLLKEYCEASGYQAITASTGDEALRLFETEDPHLALLDITIPNVDGIEVCRMIRKESTIPIIMVSSRKEDADKILALGLGADDFVEKPFSPRVLMARIQSNLRRYEETSGIHADERLHVREIKIHLPSRQCTVNNESIALSVKEFDLLCYLLRNKNLVLTREKIFDNVWGTIETGDIGTVTVHIKKLREKIEPTPSQPIYIETVRGVGYVIKG